MPELPTGTVTFLFTDIERSTELLTALGDRYPDVLERHNELLRAAFARHDGIEVNTEGDAFFVVFRVPAKGIRAAVDAQRALAAAPWPDGAEIRVRMGIHTGEGVLGAGDYVGLDVHRAARIAAAARGGQMLVSDATRALAERALGEDVSLRDLGAHRLKGLPSAERLFQVEVEGLRQEFPPLATLEARPNNLPAALTTFVGREQEIANVRQRLAGTRLLTLTGPGGTGKTRLSLRVAEEVLGEYEHGCWFVALEALRDPELVPATMADVLGVRVPADKLPIEALESWLADRRVLLVLDNVEQVTGAGGHVSRLLRSAPGLTVLATSRVPLRVYGEQEYPVPPLAAAADLRAAGAAGAESLSQYEAVRLFIERAVAVKPDFRVTNQNAPAVAEICARLDGLPLALELAAARIKLLTPEQMLARLEGSLTLLTSTARDLPERQRTLRGAIDWSHELLEPVERRLFARLAVFRGGFTLEAAESVCADELGLDVVDGLSALVDNSLLRAVDVGGASRFSMLETIREYARQQLVDSGESGPIMGRHAEHYFALARRAGAAILGPDQVAALAEVDAEIDNLRAAFERAPELGMLDEARAAAGAIWRFWQLRAHFAEGRQVLDRLLAHPGGEPRARAAALTGAGGLAYWQGDFDPMERYYREARELYEAADDRPRLAEALYNESYVYALVGDFAAARPLIERAIGLHREAGNEIGATEAELFLGFTYYMDADPRHAVALVERAIATYRAAGARWSLADALTGYAYVHASIGNWDKVAGGLREALAVFSEMGSELGMAMVFEATSSAAAWVGDAERAALLAGWASSARERLGGGAPSQIFFAASYQDRARDELGAEEYERLSAAGSQLSAEQAAELVELFAPPPDAPPVPRVLAFAAGAGES